MKSSFNRDHSKASTRYQFTNENENTKNESPKYSPKDMNDSLEDAPKAKYLSEFFNKLQKTYTSGTKQIKELKESKEFKEGILNNPGSKSRSTLHNNFEPKKEHKNLKKEKLSIPKKIKKDLGKSVDKSINTTIGNLNTTNFNNSSLIHNHNGHLFNITQKLSQIEEDKKCFLLDVGLCDTDLLNSETNGLNTPKEIDCFSSNDNSHNSDFDLSRMSNLSLLEEKKKLKQEDDKKKMSSKSNNLNITTTQDKNLKKNSNDKFIINRDFETCNNDILAANKNNLRKSMNCLPNKLSGKAANKAKTTKTLLLSVKKLQAINTPQEKITKQNSKESYNPDNTGNSIGREKTPTSASTRKDEKIKTKPDLNPNKKLKNSGFSNNFNTKATNLKKINTITEKESIDLDNLHSNKSTKKLPLLNKLGSMATNTSINFKTDRRIRNSSINIKDNSNQSISLMNHLVGTNTSEDLNIDSRKDNRKLALNSVNLNQYDELITELEEIFGENLENFDEELLFCTLEDFDTKILIRSLILLSFEQKKLIKKLQAQIKETEKDSEKEKNAGQLIEPLRQVKFSDRAEFFTKLSEREVPDTKIFLAYEKGAAQNYHSRITESILSGRNKESSSISKVLPVRSSSVIIKLPPKQNKALNNSLMDGIVGLKKNTKPLKKFL